MRAAIILDLGGAPAVGRTKAKKQVCQHESVSCHDFALRVDMCVEYTIHV